MADQVSDRQFCIVIELTLGFRLKEFEVRKSLRKR